MLEFPTMECSSPSETHVIGVKPGETAFNVTELKLPKNTCVKIQFFNPDDEEHDFTVLDEDGEEWIHMDAEFVDDDEGLNHSRLVDGELVNFTCYFGYPENKTTMEEQGKGLATHFYMTPDKDITLTAFCEETGHQDAGMEFPVIIGSGTATPGFELPIFIFSIFVVGVSATLYKKSRK